MRKSMYIFMLLFVGSLSIMTSCQKNKTGDLVINVVDGLNSSVGAGKTVYLYNNLTDYDNAVYSKTADTDANGQVTFKTLEPGTYYADCDWTNNLGMTITSSGSGTVEMKKVTTITLAP